MHFWVRELLGWLFMLLGLALIGLCIMFVNSRLMVEGSITAFVGVMVFRAGIHLLKVAVAARIYMNTRSSPNAQTPAELAVGKPRPIVHSRTDSLSGAKETGRSHQSAKSP